MLCNSFVKNNFLKYLSIKIKTGAGEMELGVGSTYLLLLQRDRIQVSGPTLSGLQCTVTLIVANLMSSSGSHGHMNTHVAYAYTQAPTK